ncbi:M23 family metallopeptidase [Bacillaceae bacterium S4-13-58]
MFKCRPLRPVLIVGIGLFILFVAFGEQREVHNAWTNYHVLVDGVEIGIVDETKLVEDFLTNKLAEYNEMYPGIELDVTKDITYLPEKVFHPIFENEKVLQNLNQQITIGTYASKLEVNGELVGFLPDENKINNVLKKVKEFYVSKQQGSPPGDYKIINLSFEQDVTVSKEIIDPKELLTEDQAFKLLTKGNYKEQNHTIKEGDVLGQIAMEHDLSLQQIQKINPSLSEDSILQLGETITVTENDPLLDVILVGQAKQKEVIEYETIIEESSTLLKGQTKVKQQGKNGKKEVYFQITKKNGREIKKELISENILTEPVNKIVIKGTKASSTSGSGRFIWPTVGGQVTSPMGPRWGSYHRGIDIAGVSDRTIKAADGGTVSFAGWDGTYGNKVLINHRNGYQTLYSHLSRIDVKVGQVVSQGERVGLMGETGRTTGVNLHFEITKNGSLVNPLNYIQK